jgi:phosphatidylserine decarboxylase
MKVLSGRIPNSIYGLLQRLPSSRGDIPSFATSLGIDTTEAEHPLDSYRSMDEFFTRRLGAAARPVDPDPSHLISPADGRVLVYPRICDQMLQVKQSRIALEELLRDKATAQRYAEGVAIVIRLAPADYHRFHFPDAGVAGEPRPIRGRLHSVHPIALAAGAPSLRNKRCITQLNTEQWGTLGLIEIGALCVGTIVQTYTPGAVERGQEKGFFRFGGSTVIVLAEPGRVELDDDLVAASAEGMETLVRFGTRVARCK